MREDTGAIGIGLKLPLTDEVRSWLPPLLTTGRSMIIAPAPSFLSISVFDHRSASAGKARWDDKRDGASMPSPGMLVDSAVAVSKTGFRMLNALMHRRQRRAQESRSVMQT